MARAMDAKPGDTILILSGDDVMKTRKQLCELRLSKWIRASSVCATKTNLRTSPRVVDFPML